jgi:transglutaminase-like putative cysteine protease/tetratricopeptide (TPR) repeat protein
MQKLAPQYCAPALVFRSAALFAILFQIRLAATELADTSVFTVAILAGFTVAVFLFVLRQNGKAVKPAAAVVSIALIPWAVRALIAIPRLFIPHSSGSSAVILDSLLLNLDRNNFVSLLPYYWSAVSTFFSIRSRKFLRASVIADASLLLFIYSVIHSAIIEIYRWPIIIIILFGAVVFLQALALLFSMPPETRLRPKEIYSAAAALLAIIVFGGNFFLKPFQEQAAKMGGGLLEPKFFSFGFSKYPKLNSEISMKNDLVMIVKKENDTKFLARQLVLSGYNKKQGFYQIEELDEKTHPQRLPSRRTSYAQSVFRGGRNVVQEYFLVNIDPSSFFALKQPVSVSPYESWNTSSFKSAYAVESRVSDANYWDLHFSTASGEHPTPEDLGLSEKEFKIYTEYGNDERLRSLAEKITNGCDRYTEKVSAVFNFLKNGDYRYSLKPGVAQDGDQLGRFLFQVKKGYCVYFAYSMTLLLRSLDIPARVASGFYIDLENNTFDYYPVRMDMAHSWVEVAFPQYGWIEFDPTSDEVAQGEEFQASQGMDSELFEKLMREILENRPAMKVREGGNEDEVASSGNSPVQRIIALVKNHWQKTLAVLFAALFLYIRCGIFISVFLTRDTRKKSVRLMKHACRLLRLYGLRRGNDLGEPEWALQIDNRYRGIYSMYQSSAAARFAPEYSRQDFDLQRANYKNFASSLRREIPLWRRMAAWILPPLALAFGPAHEKKQTKKGTPSVRTGAPFLLIFLLSGIIAASQAEEQNGGETELTGADELFANASAADYAENWERAIELYREGVTRFADDARFSWSLGNLYYGRSLYSLAWDEYRKTEIISPDNPAVLIRLARTAGYLNRDLASVDYYERALELDSGSKDAIGSLGWMYFKVHRLADGEKLLASALEQFGDDPDFAMTLGTIYSDMYRYDESKLWYNRAIALGESIGDRIFTAIAWYNLSILESRFYKYELCMDATNSSLNILNRASGRLARGELFMRQLELEKAQKDYETAYGIDTSPLAKLNLAHAYQVSGRLEEARLYAEDCLKGTDNSWMLNFGTDPDRYKRDIHLILANIYSGLAETEKLLPREQAREKILSLFRITSYRLKHAVNIRLYRKYCLAAADAYSGKIFNEGPPLDSFIQYYNAFKPYPRRALAYLNKARDFETSLIPAAIPTYDFEEGILLGMENITEKALYGFDPLWERELISKCYSEFAKPKRSGLFRLRHRNPGTSAQELFILNRGALRQSGIKLPVQIKLLFNEETPSARKHFGRALEAAGFKNSPAGTARFTLNIRIENSPSPDISGYTVFSELVDNDAQTSSLRHKFTLPSLSRAECYSAVRDLGNKIFTVE